MKRRTIVQAVPGLAALGLIGGAAAVRAQDATPDSTPDAPAVIPPIRWNLSSIDAGDDSQTPEDPTRFSLQFFSDGHVSMTADCNVGGGSYSIDGENITIENLFTTLAFCGDDSLDQAFTTAIQTATTWSISNDPGDLLSLNTGDDGSGVRMDPALQGVVWQWQEFLGGDDSVITPDDPGRYTIEFMDDWSVQVVADCNNGNGSAAVDGSSIDLVIGMTRKMCAEDSFFDDYVRILDEAVEWLVSGGELYLNLPMDGGGARFAPVPYAYDEATPAP